ncbi:type II toxin-antitoxin system PemK/MazF family toxin [bacterium]|nr:type II toxin-antitoxin system PemK/MazF family toxin [bacterium]MCK4436790.1 type II toxin-antitoxin system PemK/MazF family toxin [bacterium]
MMNYKFGEVVLVDFPESGAANMKRRPALVVLDIGDADIVLAPITTKERSGRGDYKLRDWSSSGLLRDSWVRLAKISCLGKSDIARRLGRLTDHDKGMLVTVWQTLHTF